MDGEAIKANDTGALEDQKPTGEMVNTEEAALQDKPVENQDDMTNVVMILNELDQLEGGTGSIVEIPEELKVAVKKLVDIGLTIREAFQDPLFKDVMDDLVDQKSDGKTPSVLVAVARNVPMEDIQELADNENYELVQNAVEERISGEQKAREDEDMLYSNFDSSKANIDSYCEKMGYDEAKKEKMYALIAMLRDAFADGLLSEKEIESIDKMDNYDTDISNLESQMPKQPEKEILPDRASMDATMKGKKEETKRSPSNNLESMAMNFPTGEDITQVGKRRFTKQK